MLKRTLSQKKNKSYEDIHYSCTIRFLDDSEPLSVTFQKETRGEWLIDDVCKKLDLEEKDYFGLRYVDSDKQRHWLDPLKPIYKQLKQVYPAVLCFRVKFYPTDPTKLKEEITRYHLFLQLRRDLHHGRLLCSPQDANLLAAYVIQSEVGDYEPEEQQAGYVAQFKMLPKQTSKQEERIAELHKTLTGEMPADVEINFLKKASSLDTYGVDPHPVKTKAFGNLGDDQKGNQMYLGVTHLGIVTFQGNKRTHLFKWSQITKIAFEGKMFIVHVTISEDSENALIVKKKKHACGFKCPTFSACKHLWKCAVEQQYFFTLDKASEAPRVTSGGGWFSRGSRFRFSGRCQREVYSQSAKLQRDEPSFDRCVSNPSLVKSYNKRRSESLPSKLKDIALSDSPGRMLDDSTQSLIAGELSIEQAPNGSVVSDTTIHGLPQQEAVQVSDKPYEPMQSPSREDLANTSITPIPEDAALVTSEEPEDEASDAKLPRYSEVMQSMEAAAGQAGGDGLDAEAAVTAEVEEQLIDPDQTSLMTTAAMPTDSVTQQQQQQQHQQQQPNNHVAANTQPPAEAVAAADTVANQGEVREAKLQQGLRFCRLLTLTILFVFTLMFVTVLFALESELDMPVIRDLRAMPELQDFKHAHYIPFKSSLVKRLGTISK